ncbi:MAG: inner-membrane translocator [Ktedonobacteraceae bacterium]|nr:inner-membrane translocator [Ktedonobacteraceae bacterium]
MPRQTLRQALRTDLGFLPVLATLVIIVVYFAITTDGIFLSPRNFSELVQEIATIGILSLGSTFVLLIGEIDLSVASVSTLCSVVMAVLSERVGLPAWIAIAAALLTGALVGFVNGIFVAVVRVPSFIVTLAGSIAYAGLLLTLLAGQSTLIISNDFILSIAGTPTSFLTDILGIGLPTLILLIYLGAVIFTYVRRKRAGLSTISLAQLVLQLGLAVVLVEGAVVLFESYFGVPNSTAILFGFIVLFWLILTKTPFGRHVYAVGGNAEAARRAGINVIAIRIALFTLCSLLAAIGGVVAASRANAVASQIDPTLLLEAIAAAVIGGVSLFGGRGSVWSIVLGVLIIGSLENGLTLKSQPPNIKEMVEGAVLVIAVTVDALLRRLQVRSGR